MDLTHIYIYIYIKVYKEMGIYFAHGGDEQKNEEKKNVQDNGKKVSYAFLLFFSF